MVYRQREVYSCQSSTDVRGHIVITFCRMDEERITIWDHASKEGLQIPTDIRIGILLDQ